MKNALANIFAVVYFVAVMLPLMVSLLISQYGMINGFISVWKSGFSGQNNGIAILGVFGLFFGISMLVPALRRMYRKLPWLYSYIHVLMVNLFFFVMGTYILSYGYAVQNASRHTTFFVLAVAWLIASRLGICFYYKWKPIKFIEERD